MLFDDGYSQNGWTDFDAQNIIRCHLARVRSFSRNEKYRSMTLTRSKSRISCDPQNFAPNFLGNGTRIEVRYEVMYGLSNGANNFDLR